MESNEDFGEKDIKNVDDTYSGNIKGNILSLIRTTQRNYIDLTTIADNKAHILISINSLMLTILLPIILSNFQIIVEKALYIPVALLALACLLTIIFSAKVLVPFSDIKHFEETQERKGKRSPFFFTNYADLSLEEYRSLFQETISDKETINQVIVSDLYYFGINLSTKYKLVHMAYKIFNIGIIVSFLVFGLIFLL
jgi:hypothetical protein